MDFNHIHRLIIRLVSYNALIRLMVIISTTKNKSYMKTNEEVQHDVLAEIKWDPQLKDVSTQISASANDGIVTLSGIVDTYGKKMAAERAAQRVKGVKIVACDLEVDPERKKTDLEIAEAVANALYWNAAV